MLRSKKNSDAVRVSSDSEETKNDKYKVESENENPKQS